MGVRRTRLLWLLAWCGPLLLGAFAVLVAVDPRPLTVDETDLQNVYPNVVFGAVVPLLGALVLSRAPRHPIGWLFLGCGLASAATLAVYPYAILALRRDLPGAEAAAWVSEWVWGLGVIPLVTLGLLLFPDGRLPGRRWRVLLWSDLAAVLLVFLGNAFHPGRLVNHPSLTNPVGLPLPRAVFDGLSSVGFGLFVVGVVGGALAAGVRYRRAGPEQRPQLSWFAFTAAVLAVSIAVPSAVAVPRLVSDAATVVAVPLLPVSVAVAILRRHLYGVRVVVRRSLAYAALTAVLLVLYAVTVSGIGLLFRGARGETAALVGTALVAVAFAPVRQRLQGAVDRLLYGEGRDPYAVLTGVGRRLETPSGAEDALSEAAAALATSLRLPYVRLEVSTGGADSMVAEHGVAATDLHAVPLTLRGEQVGRMLVAARSPREGFRATELRLLDDLARQVAVSVHAMVLSRDLQRSQERLIGTREEERRRIRRDLHDGLGPALAGVALGLDAVARLSEADPAKAAQLAEQLKSEVRASLDDVRRLVDDLRPPALDQLGLAGAVREQAGRLSERDGSLRVVVDADGLPPLPAAVEVAAYRIATEALNNVSKHARARHCRIALRLDGDGALVVEVEDDGVGLRSHEGTGVGLPAMQERARELGGVCETGSGRGGGTRVAARLPLAAAT